MFKYILGILVLLILSMYAYADEHREHEFNVRVDGRKLTWTPPSTYIDGTKIDLLSDIRSYEVYIKTSNIFTQSDVPSVIVNAVAVVNGKKVPVHSYTLTSATNTTKWVSLKAVTVNGVRSAFSHPVKWH